MSLTHIIIYAVIQGLAELLPVSSSAHVIAATRFLRQDPTTPQFTLLLVLLHTGTMFAVIAYFWKAWKRTFFQSQTEFLRFRHENHHRDRHHGRDRPGFAKSHRED